MDRPPSAAPALNSTIAATRISANGDGERDRSVTDASVTQGQGCRAWTTKR